MISGKVWRYGDDIDTDVIIPTIWVQFTDPVLLGQHCMESLDPEFARKVSPGDVIVAGTNFGCGSSREHAPLAIKGAGVGCIVAKSFGRIFLRNAINMGLPLLVCPEAVDGSSQGDRLEIDTTRGEIKNLTTGRVHRATPFPEFMQRIISAGGLINYVRERLGTGQAQ